MTQIGPVAMHPMYCEAGGTRFRPPGRYALGYSNALKLI